jgi:integrase
VEVGMTPVKMTGAKGTKHPGIKKLPDGRWFVLRTWQDPKTGKRQWRKKVVTGTLEDAQRARAALRSHEKNASGSPRPRFASFAKEWLERAQRKIEPSTYARYVADVGNLGTEFDQWWVDAIDYDALERWQSTVGSQYAAATVNGWHRTMRLILDGAVRRRLLIDNPARALSTLPEGRTKGARGTALSASQMRMFLDAIPVAVAEKAITPQQGRALITMAWTGIRLGELVALKWSDVVDGELRIERSVWRGHEKADKTDDPRRITIVTPLEAALDEQRTWLLHSQHPGLGSGLIFPGNLQQARAGQKRRKAEAISWFISQSTIQEAAREVCKTAKTPRITPHSLRRTFEDLLREAGVEQLVRRAMAGWRSERAQGIYATVRREDRDAAAEAVVRLVRG